MQVGAQRANYTKRRLADHKNARVIPAVLFLHVCMFAIRMPVLCQQFKPDEWKFESQREALAPVSFVDSKTRFNGDQTLALKGGGKTYADGHWYKEVTVEPEAYFSFEGYYKAADVRTQPQCTCKDSVGR